MILRLLRYLQYCLQSFGLLVVLVLLDGSAMAAGFSSAGSLNAGRSYHTATLLQNGKVLVVGGYNGSSYLRSTEIYDPSANSWSTVANLNTARGFHSATLLPNGKVLVAGGYGTGVLNGAEIYDPAANTWTSVASLTTARYSHSAILLPSGKVLIIAGLSTSATVATAEIYDPAMNSWSSGGNLTTPRYSFTATLLQNGIVVAAGGYNSNSGGGYLSSAEKYDPNTNSWSSAGSLTTARYSYSAILLGNGRVLAAGGYNSSAEISSAEVYDPPSNSWIAMASLSTPRVNLSTSLLPDGTVLAVGGSHGSTYLSTSEKYDPYLNTWTPGGNLTNGRTLHTATALQNGKVLIAGGNNASGPILGAEVYDPGIMVASSAKASPSPVSGTTTSLTVLGALPTGESNLIYTWATTGTPPAAVTFSPNGTNAAKNSTATFTKNGVYTLQVTISDGQGNSTTSSLIVPVNQTSNSVSITPQTVTLSANATQQYTASQSDQFGNAISRLYKWSVNGGGTINGSGDSTGLFSAQSSPSHDPFTVTGSSDKFSWNSTASLANPRELHSATLLTNGKVLAVGGYSNGVALCGAELYDPATSTWTAKANLTAAQAQYSHKAVLLQNGKVLVAGGQSNNGLYADAALYDPATDSWTAAGHLNTIRYLYTATLLQSGKVLIVGGYNSGYQATAELYDPNGNNSPWASAGHLQKARFTPSVTLTMQRATACRCAGSPQRGRRLRAPTTPMRRITPSRSVGIRSAAWTRTTTTMPTVPGLRWWKVARRRIISTPRTAWYPR